MGVCSSHMRYGNIGVAPHYDLRCRTISALWLSCEIYQSIGFEYKACNFMIKVLMKKSIYWPKPKSPRKQATSITTLVLIFVIFSKSCQQLNELAWWLQVSGPRDWEELICHCWSLEASASCQPDFSLARALLVAFHHCLSCMFHIVPVCFKIKTPVSKAVGYIECKT